MSGTALVVGGGIAGLVAAHRLSAAGWDVTLAEATSVLGGAVSPRFLDVPSHGETGAPETQTLELDGGAESFAVRGAAVRALVEELGLGEKIVAPEPLGSWLHGPAGPVRAPRLGIVGIPGDLDAEDLAAALTPAGLERARQDAEAPMDRWAAALAAGEPVTVAQVVADRLGDEVLDRLVAPVVAGVHSADPAVVELERVAPGLLAAAVEHGGLAAGVAALRSTGTPGSLVAGLDGGMVRLTGRLVEALRERRPPPAEVLVEDEDATTLTGVLVNAAQTGKIGDGKVWVSSVDQVIRVRTGASGPDAL